MARRGAKTGTHTGLPATVRQAAEWRLLGLLFERPRAGWHEEIARLAREIDDPGVRAATSAARDATEGEFLRLVGPGGAVSPREVTYRPFEDPGRILAELATVYPAFAYQPRSEEPADHLAVEVGFVGYLLLKEAYAAAGGDRKAAAIAAATRRDFVETHLAPMATPFAERLRAAGPSYLLECARVLAARVPPPRTDGAAPDPAAVPGGCSSCGTA